MENELPIKSEEPTECPICYDPFELNDSICRFNCNHVLCMTCDDICLKNSINSCPLCRAVRKIMLSHNNVNDNLTIPLMSLYYGRPVTIERFSFHHTPFSGQSPGIVVLTPHSEEVHLEVIEPEVSMPNFNVERIESIVGLPTRNPVTIQQFVQFVNVQRCKKPKKIKVNDPNKYKQAKNNWNTIKTQMKCQRRY